MELLDHQGLLGGQSLHNDVYALIVESIHRGELRPGDRLNEAAIARRLGISRAPVREAIGRLAHEGLVQRRPRLGAFIPELTAKDLDDIKEVRLLIEGYAARRASARLTPAHERALRDLIRAMGELAKAGKWTETASLNARFHQTVIEIADNPRLNRVWSSLDPLAWLLAPAIPTVDVHDPEDMVTRHQSLLDALLSGDPDRASDAFQEHALESFRRMHELLARESTGGVDSRRSPASEQADRPSQGTGMKLRRSELIRAPAARNF